MSWAGVVDLPRVRAALAELDRLVEAHPELRGQSGAANRAAWLAELETMEGDNVATNDKQTAIRIPAELMDRLDRMATLWRRERPGARMTRSDALRVLLLQALDGAERAEEAKRLAWLKDWRAQRNEAAILDATGDGGRVAENALPAELLERIAKQNPQSTTELRAIAGMGEGRVDTFGHELLVVLAGHWPPSPRGR